MATQPERVPPPGMKFPFKAVLDSVARLRSRALLDHNGFFGSSFTADIEVEFCQFVELYLGISNRTNLLSALMPFVSKTVDETSLMEMLWKVVCQQPRIDGGLEIVHAPTPQFPSEWTGLRIAAADESCFSKTGKQMGVITFRAFHGAYGGLQFTQRVPVRRWQYYFARRMGMKPATFVFKNLTNLQLVGLLEVQEYKDQFRFNVADVHRNQSAVTENKLLLKSRSEPCEQGYKWTCEKCSIGYEGIRGCRKATHPKTYTRGVCSICQIDGSIIDPGQSTRVCMSCLKRRRDDGQSGS